MMCNILLFYLAKRTIINPEIHSSVPVRESNFHFLSSLWPSACSAFYANLDYEYDVNKSFL